MKPESPLLTVTVDDLDGRPLGHVVVDSFVQGTSSGGVRLVDDVSLDEIRCLAREMTLKFGFAGLTRGGAKAGVRLGLDTDRATRDEVLERFGRGIRPLIEKGVYYPGRDLNCADEDLRAIYRGAGVQLGEITDSSYFTALSVAAAVHACESTTSARTEPLTIAIQGFGSVASHLAKILQPPAYRIVAISTARGGRYLQEGFRPEDLIAAWSELGVEFPRAMSLGEPISLDGVLSADVDMLIPAARTRAISLDNAASIRARWIVPAANAPYDEGAEEYLSGRGVVCLSGFVCNVGGVYGSSLSDRGVSQRDIIRVTNEHYEPVIRALLERSAAIGLSPVRLAESVAEVRSREMLSKSGGHVWKLMGKLRRRGLVPSHLDGAMFLRQFERELDELEQRIRGWSA